MAWEGTDDYGSLDEALRAMEAGIASWLEEHRPDGGRGERARKKPLSGIARSPKPSEEVIAEGNTPEA